MAAGHPAGHVILPGALKYPEETVDVGPVMLVDVEVQGKVVLVGQGKEPVDLPHGVRGKEGIASQEIHPARPGGRPELGVILLPVLHDAQQVQSAPVLLLQLLQGLKGGHAPLGTDQYMGLDCAGAGGQLPVQHPAGAGLDVLHHAPLGNACQIAGKDPIGLLQIGGVLLHGGQSLVQVGVGLHKAGNDQLTGRLHLHGPRIGQPFAHGLNPALRNGDVQALSHAEHRRSTDQHITDTHRLLLLIWIGRGPFRVSG